MMPTASRPSGLWEAIDQILARADLTGVLAHRLGPLAAIRLRTLDLPLPPQLEGEERAATLANLAAVPLVFKIREACDGPVLLLKGPEVGALYPRAGRRFGDVDILTPSAETVQDSLLANGFVPGEPDFDMSDGLHHHLEPVRWPTIALNVEVHSAPNWPPRAKRPPLEEILEAAVPSALQVQGVSAPHPLHHALILSSHAWRHEPLHRIRDLLDIAVVSDGLDARELDRLAAKWGMTKIWSTTTATIEALFYGGRRTVPLRSWARHLEEIRPRTVFENHLQRWVGAFWEEPPGPALARLGHELRDDIRPDAGETWGTKLGRVGRAAVNPRRRVALREPAAGSAERPPETGD